MTMMASNDSVTGIVTRPSQRNRRNGSLKCYFYGVSLRNAIRNLKLLFLKKPVLTSVDKITKSNGITFGH